MKFKNLKEEAKHSKAVRSPLSYSSSNVSQWSLSGATSISGGNNKDDNNDDDIEDNDCDNNDNDENNDYDNMHKKDLVVD